MSPLAPYAPGETALALKDALKSARLVLEDVDRILDLTNMIKETHASSLAVHPETQSS